jgi:hypothetical protein
LRTIFFHLILLTSGMFWVSPYRPIWFSKQLQACVTMPQLMHYVLIKIWNCFLARSGWFSPVILATAPRTPVKFVRRIPTTPK